MTKLMYLTFILSLLTACGSLKKFSISDLDRVYLEYNPVEPLQYGGTFEAKILALKTNGEEVDLTNYHDLDFISTDLSKSGKRFTIIKRPTSFNEEPMRMQYYIKKKKESYTFSDSMNVNLWGDLSVDCSGFNGTNAQDQSSTSSTSVLFRDGRNGDFGLHGTNGQNGQNYVVYLWKEKDEYFVYVLNSDTQQEMRYKSKRPEDFKFDFSGGNGGNGGNGGAGGDGRDGEVKNGKSKAPGHGGHGGDGGSGGNGGNAGTVMFFLHPSAVDIEGRISFDMSSGRGGQYGNGGKGGQPGKPLAGQLPASPGVQGRNGFAGMSGLSGQTPLISVREFDYSSFVK